MSKLEYATGQYYTTRVLLRSIAECILQIRHWGHGFLLFESLRDSHPMLGAGSSSGVELFQVCMGTRLWQDGADQQVFHGLFIPTFARCLSILVESPFLHEGFASSWYRIYMMIYHHQPPSSRWQIATVRGDTARQQCVAVCHTT